MMAPTLPAAGELLLDGVAGKLQAALEYSAQPARFGALVCHPNPLQGGTYTNKVVTSLTRLCRREGGAALRFNFRGVGLSEGEHDAGRGETADAVQLANWMRGHLDAPLWLAGFSFGSMVACRAAVELAHAGNSVSHLVLVAPPVHFYDWPTLAEAQTEVTIIQGEADEVVPADKVYDWAEKQTKEAAIIRVADCSHFFHGHLSDLMQAAKITLP